MLSSTVRSLCVAATSFFRLGGRSGVPALLGCRAISPSARAGVDQPGPSFYHIVRRANRFDQPAIGNQGAYASRVW